MKLSPRLLALASIVLLAGFTAQVAAQSFTLEQVMSSPFPSELTISKRGDKIAWALDAQGKRNIWIAETEALAARPLTHYDSDDGQALSGLVFSPSGSSIAYVRGVGKNQSGEYPNPTTATAGARQSVWIVDVRTGRTTQIGEGSNPMFTPAGDQIIWIRDGDLHGVHDWSVNVAGLRVPTDTAERARIARESSPISSIDKWKSPVLLIHADDDRNVEFAQTVNLVRLLRKHGVYFEEIIYPDEIHDFLRHQNWVRAYRASAEFFDEHLK